MGDTWRYEDTSMLGPYQVGLFGNALDRAALLGRFRMARTSKLLDAGDSGVLLRIHFVDLRDLLGSFLLNLRESIRAGKFRRRSPVRLRRRWG